MLLLMPDTQLPTSLVMPPIPPTGMPIAPPLTTEPKPIVKLGTKPPLPPTTPTLPILLQLMTCMMLASSLAPLPLMPPVLFTLLPMSALLLPAPPRPLPLLPPVPLIPSLRRTTVAHHTAPAPLYPTSSHRLAPPPRLRESAPVQPTWPMLVMPLPLMLARPPVSPTELPVQPTHSTAIPILLL